MGPKNWEGVKPGEKMNFAGGLLDVMFARRLPDGSRAVHLKTFGMKLKVRVTEGQPKLKHSWVNMGAFVE